MSKTHNSTKKQLSVAALAIVAKAGLFWLSIETLQQLIHGALVLWRHIRRLLLHAQIGEKAIFTSE